MYPLQPLRLFLSLYHNYLKSPVLNNRKTITISTQPKGILGQFFKIYILLNFNIGKHENILKISLLFKSAINTCVPPLE